MTTTTRPVRRPSDRKPKASVIAAQQKAAQIAAQQAERDRSYEEFKATAMADFPTFPTNATPVDENTLRREQLINSGIGSKKTAAMLTVLALLFVGLVVGSIVLFFNQLIIPAVIALFVASGALLGLSLWVKSMYSSLVNEFGREETIDLLLSMAKGKNEVEKDAA